jgi:RNA polymerase sigma factor (sigma-70 family)
VTQLPPFQTLLDAHGRDVHRFLVASVGAHDADDCYQETWIAALRAYPKLRDASNLRGWLLTIASHKVVDHVRVRKRSAVPVGDAPVDAAPAGLAGSAGAEVGVDAADLGGVWTHVRRLPEKQRMAVALRFVLDADYAAIAETMSTSQEAARRNVHEGLKRLRTEYA